MSPCSPTRHLEIEPAVNAVFVHLAQVVIHAGSAKHRAGDGGADRQFLRQHADELRARQDNFVLGEKGSKFVEKLAVVADNFLRLRQPFIAHVHADAAEAHIIAHHPRAADGLEQIENFLAFAEGIHHRRAERAHVLQEKTDETGVILEAREFRHDDADVFGAFGHGQAGELLDGQRVSPVVRHRTEIIQPIRVRHGGEIGNVLADFLVVAVEIAEHRLELHDLFRRRAPRPCGTRRAWTDDAAPSKFRATRQWACRSRRAWASPQNFSAAWRRTAFTLSPPLAFTSGLGSTG